MMKRMAVTWPVKRVLLGAASVFILAVAITSVSHGQRVQGNLAVHGAATSFPNSLGPTRHLILSVDGWCHWCRSDTIIEPIWVVDGGDAFGRVSTYWTEYCWEVCFGEGLWLYIFGNSYPYRIHVGAKVGDSWQYGLKASVGLACCGLFCLCGGQKAIMGVWVNNAPTPAVSGAPSLSTNLASYDIDGNPSNGIQIDNERTPEVTISWSVGNSTVYRDNAGYHAAAAAWWNWDWVLLPSPHRDDVYMKGSLKIQGGEAQSFTSPTRTFGASEGATSRQLNGGGNSYYLNLRSYRPGDSIQVQVIAEVWQTAWYRGDYVLGSQRVGNYTLNQTIQIVCSPRNGDVDRNGCVDDADLLRVLFAFGETGQNPADSNCDGTVDDADLLEVLFNFGSGC